MRVVECSRIGPIEALEVVEHPDPTPGPGMVVVDVDAAGVNYVDALFVQGSYQIKPPVPFVPGSEVAGTVSSVGEGVDATLVGTRVVAMCGLGGFAEKVVVGAVGAVPIPDVLDSATAAGFIQSWCTARFALEHRAHLSSGESVLVCGAGGGVGQAAVAIAAAAGARVAAVASTPGKRRAALDAGAEIAFDACGRQADAAGVIEGAKGSADATEPDRDASTALVHAVREWSGGGVDVAFDPVGGDMAVTALRCLGVFGRLLVIGFPAGIPQLPANQILLRNRAVLGVDWGAWTMKDPEGQRVLLEGLLTDVAAGILAPRSPQPRPFADVVGALEDLLGRRVTGKLVLVP